MRGDQAKSKRVSRFVKDGGSRLQQSEEFNERLHVLKASIRERYAEQLAEAGFFRRLMLRWRMAAEYRRERKRIEPSQYALYGAHSVAAHSTKK
jgi:hypothetical protein